MYSKADLHIHTCASDGKYSPEEIVDMALSEKVDLISITDHDTVASLDKALEYGEKNNLKVIPGIELSTLHNGESIHVLGYFSGKVFKNPKFLNYIKSIADYRVERAKMMVENLYKFFNINLDYETILKSADGIIARPHIVKAIIEAGYPYSWDYVFKNILGQDSPAYVPNKKLSTKDGIDFLKSVDALTVLAHPVLIKSSSAEELLKFGFDGIEAIYHMNSESQTEYYIDLAKRNNLIITAGSDFHGISKEDGSHAEKIGTVSLNAELIDTFLEKLQSL